jgi:hypothetical protein
MEPPVVQVDTADQLAIIVVMGSTAGKPVTTGKGEYDVGSAMGLFLWWWRRRWHT